jgi:hypothetical protein
MTDFITITDTGKRRTSSASAEETDKANSGTTITVYGAELTVEDSSSLNTNPVIGKYSTPTDAATKWAFGEVDTIGVNKPKWTARGLLDQDDSSQMALVKALRELSRTKGYKTLGGDLPDWTDGVDNGSTVNVHVKSVKIIHQSNSNLIDYTIEMYETE